ncbi:recombinase family protein [Streptomyces sp. NPDC102381]|uniref:recombinase family protein n=1 Tax=Streptomyces sp. NPDC102381 TaxID=3366164 RepID=UPI0037F1BE85
MPTTDSSTPSSGPDCSGDLYDLRARDALLPADSPRALLSVRLSVVTQTSTSAVRQEIELRKEALRRGFRVVGIASDMNVSATKIPPWQRPQLGDWLNQRAPEFDVIVFTHLDRFVRRAADLKIMIDWCREWSKGLVSVHDRFDLGSPAGQDIAAVVAGLAMAEATDNGARVKSLWSYSRRQERWLIGKPPYGYTTTEEGGFRRLVVDTQQKRALRWAYSLLSRGHSVSRICLLFGRAGIPSATGRRWAPTTLSKLLKNPALMGYKVRKVDGTSSNLPSVVVRDTADAPVRVAEPVFSDEEFAEIQGILNARPGAKNQRSSTRTSRFLGVLLCRHCGGRMKRDRQVKRRDGEDRIYDYLRCGSPKESCPGFLTKHPDVTYSALFDAALERLGHLEVHARVLLAHASAPKASTLGPGDCAWVRKPQAMLFRERWSRAEGTMEGDLRRACVTAVVQGTGQVDLLVPENIDQCLDLTEDLFPKGPPSST